MITRRRILARLISAVAAPLAAAKAYSKTYSIGDAPSGSSGPSSILDLMDIGVERTILITYTYGESILPKQVAQQIVMLAYGPIISVNKVFIDGKPIKDFEALQPLNPQPTSPRRWEYPFTACVERFDEEYS
jgi:hypothetical protein